MNRNMKASLVLFVGGVLMGCCIAAAFAVGWASVKMAELVEVER